MYELMLEIQFVTENDGASANILKSYMRRRTRGGCTGSA